MKGKNTEKINGCKYTFKHVFIAPIFIYSFYACITYERVLWMWLCYNKVHVKWEREQKNSLKEEIRVQGLWTQSEREEKNAIKIKMQKTSMEHGGWKHSGTGWQKGYKMWPAENGQMRFVSKPSKSRLKSVSDILLPWFHSTALLNDALWAMSANDTVYGLVLIQHFPTLYTLAHKALYRPCLIHPFT